MVANTVFATPAQPFLPMHIENSDLFTVNAIMDDYLVGGTAPQDIVKKYHGHVDTSFANQTPFSLPGRIFTTCNIFYKTPKYPTASESISFNIAKSASLSLSKLTALWGKPQRGMTMANGPIHLKDIKTRPSDLVYTTYYFPFPVHAKHKLRGKITVQVTAGSDASKQFVREISITRLPA